MSPSIERDGHQLTAFEGFHDTRARTSRHVILLRGFRNSSTQRWADWIYRGTLESCADRASVPNCFTVAANRLRPDFWRGHGHSRVGQGPVAAADRTSKVRYAIATMKSG